ncbi:MAG: hypothetical protein AAF532_03725 [Planctomycetota bacterium]
MIRTGILLLGVIASASAVETHAGTRLVSKADFGEAWPLVFDQVLVTGEPYRDVELHWIETPDGDRYALNFFARRVKDCPEVPLRLIRPDPEFFAAAKEFLGRNPAPDEVSYLSLEPLHRVAASLVGSRETGRFPPGHAATAVGDPAPPDWRFLLFASVPAAAAGGLYARGKLRRTAGTAARAGADSASAASPETRRTAPRAESRARREATEGDVRRDRDDRLAADLLDGIGRGHV